MKHHAFVLLKHVEAAQLLFPKPTQKLPRAPSMQSFPLGLANMRASKIRGT